jgi:hypothetical protein
MKISHFLETTIKAGVITIDTNEKIKTYREEYEKIKRQIKLSVYRVGTKTVVHGKIPSSIKDVYYDTLIELYKEGKSLEDTHIKIFSNSPSFVYFLAYVFYNLEDPEMDPAVKGMIVDQFHKKIPKNNLTADITAKKIGKEVLHGEPVIRNPYGIPLLDKTLYFTIFKLMETYSDDDRRSLTKLKNRTSQVFPSYIKLESSIASFEKMMIYREKMKMEMQKKVAKEKLGNTAIAKEAEAKIDQGKNVAIRHLKAGGSSVRIRETSNVNRIKASSSTINKIKKMK